MGIGLTTACSTDDDGGTGNGSGTITGLDFVITEENDTGNEVGVQASASGAETYTVDFGDPNAANNEDVISTSGPKVTYTYPEVTGTYNIKVTASAANAASVEKTKSHTVNFAAATVLADFEDASKINPRDDKSGNATISIESQTGMDGQTSNVGVAVYNGAGNWDAFSLNPTNYINPINKGIITVEYYQSEGVARDILLKLEGTKTDQAGIFDVEVLTTSTAATGWQTLTFDFHSNDVMNSHPNGAEPVILDEYSKMSIFVDFGTAVAGTYWFDNIEGAEWGIAVPDSDGDGVIDSIDNCVDTAGLPEDDGCPKSGIGEDPQDDFEGSGNIAWTPDGATILEQPVANPFKTGINTSNNVLKYQDNSQQYANIRFDLNEAKTDKFDLSTKNVFKVMVYVPTPETPVTEPKQLALKLQDGSSSTPWEGQVEVIQTYEYDTWQELTFDFSAHSAATNFSRVVVQFNGENNWEDVIGYLDNFTYGTGQ